MKIALPADRSERIKVLIMIGLFGIVILYALVHFLLMPFFASIRAGRTQQEELNTLLWRAERDIQQIQRNRERNKETIQHVLDISETHRYILRPSLGNYLLVAEANLLRAAEAAKVTIGNIREVSGNPPAVAPATTRQQPFFWPYAVSLTMQAGLHDLTRFVHILQVHNPYLAIVSVGINAGSQQDPTLHAINLTVQWPVWLDPDHPTRLSAELLADEEQR